MRELSSVSNNDLAVTYLLATVKALHLPISMSDQKVEEFDQERGAEETRAMPPSTEHVTDAADKPTDGHHSGSTKQKKTRKGRHGARNQHRHKYFVRWLIQTFPQLSDTTSSSKHVLDVAGGKGETAARLVFCHQQPVVMVDPRECDIATCFESLVVPKLPNKWQQRLMAQKQANPDFVDEIVDSRFQQLVTTFDETTLETSTEIQQAVKNASLLIGMHADGATEAIVDAALQYGKPFVVIPCCVFPRLFSQRTITQSDGTIVQVRSHEQFCQYLLEKDTRFVMEVLPFEGRNVSIWWDGR